MSRNKTLTVLCPKPSLNRSLKKYFIIINRTSEKGKGYITVQKLPETNNSP